MRMVFYEPGDTVYYPVWNIKTSKELKVKDRKINFYKRSGKMYTRYLFENLLDVLVQEMHENVEDDLDNVLCISGAEGSGKSNLAYWVEKKYDPNFDMEKSYVYSFDDLLTKIHEYGEADEGSIFWMDEATNISNNRDWMHTDNKQFVTMLEMFRSRKWCLILCIPDYNRLDVYLREQRVRYSLVAEYQDWEHSPEKSRGYFKLTRMDTKSSNGFRRKNVVGYGCFDRIPAEDARKYKEIKLGTQNNKLTEMYDEKNKKDRNERMAAANRRMMLALHENGKSYEEIAEMTGIGVRSVQTYISKAKKEMQT